MSLWDEIPPEILYRRLGLADNSSDYEISGQDLEAWEHLAKVVYKVLYYPVTRCMAYNDLVESQVQDTLLHILNKRKKGKLNLEDPRRFYGYLKVLVMRYWYSTVRRLPTIGIVMSFDDFLEDIISTEDDYKKIDDMAAYHKMLSIICLGDELKEEYRLSLKYHLMKEGGDPEFDSIKKLAEKLSKDLGKKISISSAYKYIREAKKELMSLLLKTG